MKTWEIVEGNTTYYCTSKDGFQKVAKKVVQEGNKLTTTSYEYPFLAHQKKSRTETTVISYT